MTILTDFEAKLPAQLRRKFRSFQTPIDIQRYLDSLVYISEERDRSPLNVMMDRQCHCLDGGLFAALALRSIGDPGLLVDLVPGRDKNGAQLDDDHVLAVFRRHGMWGALAKSNFSFLRYREPVYRSLRELVMTFFDLYFNLDSRKALRGYTRPMDISSYDYLNYASDESGSTILYKNFYRRKPVPLISKHSETLLQPVDQRLYDSAFLGANLDWVYRPGK